MKQYALFDWDGTLREGYTLFEWIDFLRNRKEVLSDEILAYHDYLVREYKAGNITHDFLASESCLNYEKGISGLDVGVYDRLKKEYNLYDRTRQLSFAPMLFNWMKEKEIAPVVITGAPLDMIGNYFENYGIEEAYGHVLEETDGALTGRAIANHGFNKERTTAKVIERFGTAPLFAAGDSESDLPLLEAARVALIVGGKRSLVERLPNGIVVDRKESGEELINKLETELRKIGY